MADEHSNEPDDDNVTADDTADAGADHDEVTAAGEVHDDATETSSDDTTRDSATVAVRTTVNANRSVLGQLVLHYRERDVTVIVDGDAAMRMLAIIGGQISGVEDLASPYVSDARNAWVTFDRRPLAASWLPGLPDARMATVDPAVA